MIGSRARVGEQVHSENAFSRSASEPNCDGGSGDRTLSNIDRTKPSGESQNTDSIETGTDKLTLHKRTSR